MSHGNHLRPLSLDDQPCIAAPTQTICGGSLSGQLRGFGYYFSTPLDLDDNGYQYVCLSWSRRQQQNMKIKKKSFLQRLRGWFPGLWPGCCPQVSCCHLLYVTMALLFLKMMIGHKPRVCRTQPVVKYKGSITFEPSTVNAASIKDFSMDVSCCLADWSYGATLTKIKEIVPIKRHYRQVELQILIPCCIIWPLALNITLKRRKSCCSGLCAGRKGPSGS